MVKLDYETPRPRSKSRPLIVQILCFTAGLMAVSLGALMLFYFISQISGC